MAARRPLFLLLIFVMLLLTRQVPLPKSAEAQVTQPGFSEQIVFSGLINPTSMRFASDGRIFVAEKSGLIKVFQNLNDTSPTVFADLSVNVYNYWDRGLLGMALDPNFPTNPYVYVLYTYDAVIGGTAPRWGNSIDLSDPCPTPPGPTSDGCVASARLSRLKANGNHMEGTEQVLVEDWCQQYPSHSIADLVFGPDGALYVGAGDAASFLFVDYGQDGTPVNPCGDPPGGVGVAPTPPTAEGGALRAQDLRTSGDPTGFDGTILRLNPATGQPMPDNPLINSADANARKIVAYGLRNPFRMAFRPATSELWFGDVGMDIWEEIDRLPNPANGTVKNYGWPCYEGFDPQPGYSAAGLSICQGLYANPSVVTQPLFTYQHGKTVVPNEACLTGTSSLSGIAFEPLSGGAYPAEYAGALFFADYSRRCIWVVFKGSSGQPDFSTVKNFVVNAAGPVSLVMSPDGELFYVDFDGGSIRRIRNKVALTPPWQSSDIGSVGLPGSASVDGSVFAVSGSGRDIWGNSDQFRYNYQPYSGDVEITTRVSAITLTDEWAKSGLMIRETLNEASPHASIYVTGAHEIAFQRRTSAGGVTLDTTGPAVRAPYWLRIQRAGDVFTTFASPDGTTWTQVGSQVIHMASSFYVGMAVTSHNNASINTSYFDSVSVRNGLNSPPVPAIATPAQSLTWKVGDQISFSGSASDPEEGALPASALTWTLILHHCANACHTHTIQTFSGIASGSFATPDHDYPSYLELILSAVDSKGLTSTTSVNLNPKTTTLTFNSTPVSGAQVNVSLVSSTTPFTRTVIVGSTTSVIAVTPQTIGTKSYQFSSWSDGGAQTHNIVAPAGGLTLTANFQEVGGPVTAYFSDLPFTAITNGWGPVERDMSNGEDKAGDGRTITLNGKTYAKGLGVHANSEVTYTMGGACSTFTADVGVDDEAGNFGSVAFQVFADGTKLYDSGKMTATTTTKKISLKNLTGKNELRLVVDRADGKNDWDHADWADAKLTCG